MSAFLWKQREFGDYWTTEAKQNWSNRRMNEEMRTISLAVKEAAND